MARKKGYFTCPHCGARVVKGAAACRECGSDAQTGWSDGANVWEADVPTGYGPDNDFDYDEYLRREFPSNADGKVRRKLLMRVLIVTAVLLALWIWIFG